MRSVGPSKSTATLGEGASIGSGKLIPALANGSKMGWFFATREASFLTKLWE